MKLIKDKNGNWVYPEEVEKLSVKEMQLKKKTKANH